MAVRSDQELSPSPVRVDAPHMSFQGSPWNLRQKVVRAIWILIGRPLFRITFHNWYPLRAAILRLFGAQVGRGTAIRPTVRVEIPWNLQIGDSVGVGDYAILYDLGTIRIGDRTVISQYAHLCAGTHDPTDAGFELIRAPIFIGSDVWIATDVYVAPGVTVGDRTVVGARSNVFGDLPADHVCVGSPAKPIKEREIRNAGLKGVVRSQGSPRR